MQQQQQHQPVSHWTTRRSFVASAGFGGVALYGLWVAYGAAPGPLALLGLGSTSAETTPAHGNDAHGAQGAPVTADVGRDAETFRARTLRFIERHRQPDGVVYPRQESRHGPAAETPSPRPSDDAHAHADHAPVARDGVWSESMTAGGVAGPIEVPMIAGQWYYLPASLRLDVGQQYRFRLMTVDVSHGASIQFGRGARMLRLRPGRLTEVDLRFQRPGRHLVTCTVYCGAAHDVMRAVIEVV